MAKYKGQFTVQRRLRQVPREDLRATEDAGRAPADAKLTPRPKDIPAWDDMSPQQKRLFERQLGSCRRLMSRYTRASLSSIISAWQGPRPDLSGR
jgi:hypothetical protein